ncbi:MAG: transketolase [Treponema sp.]|nr:transketolase [Treponema sp.]
MGKKTVKLLEKKDTGNYSAAELAALASSFRLEMFDVLHQRGTGHWGGSSSAAEIITALYFKRLRIDTKNPQWENRDRFVLSKGHATINLYTVLAHRGFFPAKELPEFRTLGSRLQGHPNMKLPGVDFSTGALGHGLSLGAGIALAASLGGKTYNTYVLTGEGCLDEGQTWEAMLFAAKYKIRGLVFLLDNNKVQLDGTVRDILPLDPIPDKFRAFGWNLAPTAYDGNNTASILESFDWLDKSGEVWPKAIIYSTVKGKGVSFMEGKAAWHGAPIDKESYAKGRPELVADLEAKEAQL